MKRMSVIIPILAALILFFVIVVFLQNRGYRTVEYSITSPSLPKEFNGYRIAQISDLHSRRLDDLARAAASYSPDAIAITGDLIGRDDEDLTVALEAVRGLSDIADVYYVSGNHEGDSPLYGDLRRSLLAEGVHVLENGGEVVTRGVGQILISGITDPVFKNPDEDPELNLRLMTESSNLALEGHGGYSVLLAHRPEYFHIYAEAGADLILSGHAHGGAFCLPFGRAIFAPGQGLFPKYYSGVHYNDDSVLVVSRGLGDSTVPFRINSPYELVICTLISE